MADLSDRPVMHNLTTGCQRDVLNKSQRRPAKARTFTRPNTKPGNQLQAIRTAHEVSAERLGARLCVSPNLIREVEKLSGRTYEGEYKNILRAFYGDVIDEVLVVNHYTAGEGV